MGSNGTVIFLYAKSLALLQALINLAVSEDWHVNPDQVKHYYDNDLIGEGELMFYCSAVKYFWREGEAEEELKKWKNILAV